MLIVAQSALKVLSTLSSDARLVAYFSLNSIAHPNKSKNLVYFRFLLRFLVVAYVKAVLPRLIFIQRLSQQISIISLVSCAQLTFRSLAFSTKGFLASSCFATGQQVRETLPHVYTHTHIYTDAHKIHIHAHTHIQREKSYICIYIYKLLT